MVIASMCVLSVCLVLRGEDGWGGGCGGDAGGRSIALRVWKEVRESVRRVIGIVLSAATTRGARTCKIGRRGADE